MKLWVRQNLQPIQLIFPTNLEAHFSFQLKQTKDSLMRVTYFIQLYFLILMWQGFIPSSQNIKLFLASLLNLFLTRLEYLNISEFYPYRFLALSIFKLKYSFLGASASESSELAVSFITAILPYAIRFNPISGKLISFCLN